MRNHNWHIHLARFIEERRDCPFVWGQNDCCLFCADAAVLICGVDPAEPYRGQYNDEASAWQALNDYGDGTIAGALSACFVQVEITKIQRGDICLVEVNPRVKPPKMRYACALCFGSRLWAVALDNTGLKTLPLSRAISAWRVD